MLENRRKKILFRSLSVLLIALSVAFGFTNRKTGFCLGDAIFTQLGLPAWSDGSYGTHYTAIFALCLILLALWLFSATTSQSRRTFRWLVNGGIILIALINFFAV